ncbi:19042_t:CDS:2, partial [Gigaspora margarita]
MEYAENGTLREYLRNNLEWPEKIRLAKQIAEGMSYLHDIDILHFIEGHKIQEIPYNSLIIEKKLGRGGFGIVHQASSSSLGYVAIKEIEVSTTNEKKAQKVFINELKRLNGSNHERIIKFYGISLDIKKQTYHL